MPSNHLILCHPLPSGGQSTGVSTSVLPMNIQGWFPLGLTSVISFLQLISLHLKIQQCIYVYFPWQELSGMEFLENKYLLIMRGECRFSTIIHRRTGKDRNRFLWMIFLDSDQLSIQLLSVIKYGFLSVNTLALIWWREKPKAKLMSREAGIQVDLEPRQRLTALCWRDPCVPLKDLVGGIRRRVSSFTWGSSTLAFFLYIPLIRSKRAWKTSKNFHVLLVYHKCLS